MVSDVAHPVVLHRWRMDWIVRYAAAAFDVVWVLFVLEATIYPSESRSVIPVLWVMAVGLLVWTWRYACVPDVALTDSALMVQNPLSHHEIPLADIVSVTPTRNGLHITRRAAESVCAVAVQKASGDIWRKHRGRADDVAEQIRLRLPGPAAKER